MDNEELNKQKEEISNLFSESQEKLSSVTTLLENSKAKEAEINELIAKIAASNEQFKVQLNQTQAEGQEKISSITAISENAKVKEAEINELIAKVAASNEQFKVQLNQIQAEGQEKITSITAISENAKQKEQELNVFHSRIVELKATVEANSASVTEVHTQALTIRQQINDLLQAVTTSNQSVNQLLQDCTNKTSEIKSFFTIFQELKAKIENPESGLSIILSKANEHLGQIIKNGEAAAKTKEDVLSNKIKSEGLLKDTDTLKQSVNANFDESERLKKEIGKILDLVRDTGLANSFDQRRKRSQTSCLISIGAVIVGALLSSWLIHKVFFSEDGQKLFEKIDNDYIKFLIRLTLTAPGVFLAWFAATQYIKERHFLEQYEFKTAAALALENYTKLLKQNYGNTKEKEIFDLNVELIKSVYKEPEYFKSRQRFSSKFKIPKLETEGEVKSS
jgi:hypothetical protein